MAPSRVVHVISGLWTGGAEMMLCKVLGSTDRSKWDPVVLSLTSKGTLGGRIESLGIPLYTAGMRRGLPDPIRALHCVQLLKKLRPSVLHTWMYHADLIGGLAGVLGCRWPLIWSVRDDLHPTMSRLTRATIRTCALLSRWLPGVILFNSKACLLSHQRIGYSPRKLRIIPNGFDTNLFYPDPGERRRIRAELGISDHEVVIGMPARFVPGKKDHRSFVRAAGQLYQQRKNVRFVLFGQGVSADNPKLSAWVRETGIPEKFSLLGERDDVSSVIRSFDIGALVSNFEGFPNVLGEMMATCIPCVATDVGACREIVSDTGSIVNPGDVDALSNAWRELVDLGEAGRRSLGTQARQFIVQNFGMGSIARKYDYLYEEMLSTSYVRRAGAFESPRTKAGVRYSGSL